MTLEQRDTGKLPKILKPGGPVGFAGNDEEVESDQVIQVEIVEGRETKIETKQGQKEIKPKARAVVGPNGLSFIPGGSGSSLDVDDLRLLLGAENNRQVQNALRKDRVRRKEKLQGK